MNIDQNIDQISLNHLLIINVQNNDMEGVQLFIEQGADLNYDQGLALILALENNNTLMADYLLEKKLNLKNENEYFIIKNFISRNNMHAIEYLISKGVNLNIDDDALLIVACEKGHKDLVEFLLSKGLDPNKKDAQSLMTCIEKTHLDLIPTLLHNLYKEVDLKKHMSTFFKKATSLLLTEFCSLLFQERQKELQDFQKTLLEFQQYKEAHNQDKFEKIMAYITANHLKQETLKEYNNTNQSNQENKKKIL